MIVDTMQQIPGRCKACGKVILFLSSRRDALDDEEEQEGWEGVL
jgi:hypothetical protein